MPLSAVINDGYNRQIVLLITTNISKFELLKDLQVFEYSDVDTKYASAIAMQHTLRVG